MRHFLNLPSFKKTSFRSIQFSIVALMMFLGLNLGTMKSAVAAPTTVNESVPVAIFGLGRQAEGKIDEAIGKAQTATSDINKTKGLAKQAKGRAESDIGRLESSAKSVGDKTRDAVSDAADSASDAAKAAANKVKDLMTPSAASGGSDPTKGTAQMPETMQAAEDVAAKSDPMSIEEIEARNKGGLNEVQGSADKDKMYKSNTNKPGPAIVQDVKKAIDNAKK